MGYDLRLTTVARAQHWLDNMLEGKTLEMRSSDPRTLCWKIREALAAARNNKVEKYENIRVSLKVMPWGVLVTPKADLVTEIREAPRVFTEEVNEFDVVTRTDEAREKCVHFTAFNGNIEVVKQWVGSKGYSLLIGPPLEIMK